jgi:serine/threonine protein kinase
LECGEEGEEGGVQVNFAFNLVARRVTVSRPAQKPTGNPIDLVRGEIAILKKLKHKNIVQLYEVLDDPTQVTIKLKRILFSWYLNYVKREQ